MPDPGAIVLATNNPHKVSELAAIFEGRVPLIGLREACGGLDTPEPDETGTAFEANAAIKARAYAARTGRLCLADDSGLEVDALGGAPGVISSHYCTGGAPTPLSRPERDEANNIRLLGELLGTPPERRTARFVCSMALADPSGRLLATARGTFEGRIGPETAVPRGQNGFGYDPLFLVAPDFTLTAAELPAHEKNARSHRAAAAALILPKLLETLGRSERSAGGAS
jgi:XTP/dITP diphosphohydrolase